MSKEVKIDHAKINNSQTITDVMKEKFKENNLDIHKNEVENLEDDYKKGVRVLKIKNTMHFTVPHVPWHKKE